MAIAEFKLIMIPRATKPEIVQIFQLACVILGLYAAALGTTSTLNLKQKTLGTVSMVLQIIILFFIVYSIPLAIWGIVLLVKRNKAADQRMDPTTADAQP